EGRVVTWNAGAERIKGYKAEQILGHHFSCFYPPEDVAAGLPEQALQRAREHGQIETEGWRGRKDGSKVWANVVLTSRTDEASNFGGFAKITRDLTERKRAEEALRESEERTRRIVETALDAFITMDVKGVITAWNAKAEATFGWPWEEAIGRSLAETI